MNFEPVSFQIQQYGGTLRWLKIHQGTNIHIHMYVSENESILDSNKMEEKLGQNMTQVLDKWRFRIEYLYRRMGKA